MQVLRFLKHLRFDEPFGIGHSPSEISNLDLQSPGRLQVLGADGAKRSSRAATVEATGVLFEACERLHVSFRNPSGHAMGQRGIASSSVCGTGGI